MTDGNDAESSDEELLRDHVGGDPEAFAVLVRRHSDRLWAVALRTCRDPEEASDALQDAMLSAFRRAETFRGEAKVSTWLHRIVVNACFDRLRATKSRPVIPLHEDESHLQVSDGRDPIAEHDERMNVWGALAQIPIDQRAAIVLVDLEGWPVEGAAQILGCPSGTVKSRCHRGRARLAELLKAGNPVTPESVTTIDPAKQNPQKGTGE
ncbi:MAG: RNA polymerase sigma factor SigM [Candidatus Nanopelagicales bacterium]|nr:RNA polymerase sigma factor SigM [Candidatus Nanopelagicales bacterium]